MTDKKQFEKAWSYYWWKLRSFGYRYRHNEQEEREITATFTEALKKQKEAKK